MNQTPLIIGDVIRNGLIFDFKNWDREIMNGDDLTATVGRLLALLDERRIDYVLVGGVALL